MNENVPLLAIGEVYPDLTFPMLENSEYLHVDGSHHLRIFLTNPKKEEIEAVNTGQTRFGMLEREGVIFFLYRFGDFMPWSDQPFSIHLVPEDMRQIPPEEGKRALLTVSLADARDGKIHALRVITLSVNLTTLIHEALRAQEKSPWLGMEEFKRAVGRVYRKYPRPKDMVKVAKGVSKGRI